MKATKTFLLKNGAAFILTAVLLVVSAGISVASYRRLIALPVAHVPADPTREVLYLPNGRALTFFSFGFRNMLADLLWFRTISYFGKHYASDRSYRWFGHMCGLVTTLNPRAKHVYEFCSLMLAWEAGLPEESVKILTKGTENIPEYWLLFYFRGLNRMLFLNDKAGARQDFIHASGRPGAPAIVARLAAKQLVSAESPETALAFLQQVLAGTKDPTVRKPIEGRLRDVQYEVDIRQLEHAIDRYNSSHQEPLRAIEELQESGTVRAIPLDPFGGHYYYDVASKHVTSTTNHKRIKFAGAEGSGASESPK